MIVGALKLILGERANHDLIRTGESLCSVEAVFELDSNLDQVNALLENGGLEPCEGNSLVVKRVFGTGNKQFVNCSPCTLSLLKSLGGLLVDLHGPHEHQSLLSQDRQLAMLDAYAHATAERRAYREAYEAWTAARTELDEFRNQRLVSDQEIELLRFQVEEIAAASLDPAEITEIEQRYRQSQNSSRLVENASQAVDLLSAASANLGNAQRCLRELERFDPSVSERIAGFESARVEIEELESSLREYSEDLELDPSEAARIERRIDEIETPQAQVRPDRRGSPRLRSPREAAAASVGRPRGRIAPPFRRGGGRRRRRGQAGKTPFRETRQGRARAGEGDRLAPEGSRLPPLQLRDRGRDPRRTGTARTRGD